MKKWSAKLEAVSKPTEHKTVQARILAYAEAIGWTIVSPDEAAEQRAGFPTRRLPRTDGEECSPSPAPAPSSLSFPSLLDAKARDFNLHGMGYAALSPSPARQPGLSLLTLRAILAL